MRQEAPGRSQCTGAYWELLDPDPEAALGSNKTAEQAVEWWEGAGEAEPEECDDDGEGGGGGGGRQAAIFEHVESYGRQLRTMELWVVREIRPAVLSNCVTKTARS